MSAEPALAGPTRADTVPAAGFRICRTSRDRPSPAIWDALGADPTLALPSHVRALLATDQQRASRRWLFPLVRALSVWVVAMITAAKRIGPVQFSWHRAIDSLSIRLLCRFVSPEGVELLLRHFVIETNVLAYIAANAGLPASAQPTLRPTAAAQLSDSAVIEHDINVFSLLTALGQGATSAPVRAPNRLDTSMLSIPTLHTAGRRWLALDIETALYLMNIPFALFLTAEEYRRAVHSLTLDENLLKVLAALSGCDQLRHLRPVGSSLLIRSAGDVPGRLFIHTVIHEAIHHHLTRTSQ